MSDTSARRFERRTCLVTGAATGIGRATAWRLASEGASVAVADVNEAELQRTRQGIEQRGSAALAVRADLRSEQETAAALAAVERDLGPLDVLVSNAGVLLAGEVHELSVADWDATFAVNARGAFLVLRGALAGMRERRRGAICITASTSGIVGEPGTAAYAPSKAALVSLTKQVAIENAARGIRCNCVCPGWVSTPFNDPAFADDNERRETVARQVPMGREAVPDEIAAGIAFLCSDEASYVTGHALVIDGGVTLGAA